MTVVPHEEFGGSSMMLEGAFNPLVATLIEKEDAERMIPLSLIQWYYAS
jgi:hypothetical protein